MDGPRGGRRAVIGTPFAASRGAAGGAARGPSSRQWREEARDAQGRRRFHGAFSGGFSAGYYNTVGSKEGWAPSAFRSSSHRLDGEAPSAPPRGPTVEDFMDEEDFREASEGLRVAVSGDYASLRARGPPPGSADALMREAFPSDAVESNGHLHLGWALLKTAMGYSGEPGAQKGRAAALLAKWSRRKRQPSGPSTRLVPLSKARAIAPGIGVGVLPDDEGDAADEDIYNNAPLPSLWRGGSSSLQGGRSDAPAGSESDPPFEGFVKAKRNLQLSLEGVQGPPLTVPLSFTPRGPYYVEGSGSCGRASAAAVPYRGDRHLTIEQRAALLGGSDERPPPALSAGPSDPAQSFAPLPSALASKFVRSKKDPLTATGTLIERPLQGDTGDAIDKAAAPAKAAPPRGSRAFVPYGEATHRTIAWYPSSLLCKRLGIDRDLPGDGEAMSWLVPSGGSLSGTGSFRDSHEKGGASSSGPAVRASGRSTIREALSMDAVEQILKASPFARTGHAVEASALPELSSGVAALPERPPLDLLRSIFGENGAASAAPRLDVSPLKEGQGEQHAPKLGGQRERCAVPSEGDGAVAANEQASRDAGLKERSLMEERSLLQGTAHGPSALPKAAPATQSTSAALPVASRASGGQRSVKKSRHQKQLESEARRSALLSMPPIPSADGRGAADREMSAAPQEERSDAPPTLPGKRARPAASDLW